MFGLRKVKKKKIERKNTRKICVIKKIFLPNVREK